MPGCSRAGTRKSRAPSGDDAVRIGVWNSVNPASIMRWRMLAITLARSMMLRCTLVAAQVDEAVFQADLVRDISLRPPTCIGSTSAADCTTTSAACSSTSPVGSFGFTVPASRRTTVPVTVMTLSGRTRSTVSKAAEPAANTICVRP